MKISANDQHTPDCPNIPCVYVMDNHFEVTTRNETNYYRGSSTKRNGNHKTIAKRRKKNKNHKTHR